MPNGITTAPRSRLAATRIIAMSSLAMVCAVILATGAEVCGEPMPVATANEMVRSMEDDYDARAKGRRHYVKPVNDEGPSR